MTRVLAATGFAAGVLVGVRPRLGGGTLGGTKPITIKVYLYTEFV